MNLNTVCTSVQTALATVSGLTVDLYQPRSPNPPQAWIEATDYTPDTFGDTAGTIPIRVTVGVSQADYEQSYALAYELASNDTIGAALRAALQVGTITYTSIGGVFPVGEIDLRGFEILMTVVS